MKMIIIRNSTTDSDYIKMESDIFMEIIKKNPFTFLSDFPTGIRITNDNDDLIITVSDRSDFLNSLKAGDRGYRLRNTK